MRLLPRTEILLKAVRYIDVSYVLAVEWGVLCSVKCGDDE